MKSIIAMIVLSIISSCISKERGNQEAEAYPTLDTIKFIDVKTKNISSQCSSVIGGYYSKLGILISDYYILMDSLSVDLNGDRYADAVAILSPRSLEPVESKCDFSFDPKPKRLLVEIIRNSNGKSKIRGVYPNVISDIGGVLSHYSGIFITKDGFKVIHEAGSNYSWNYSTEFTITNNRLTIKSISKTCSHGDKVDSSICRYRGLSLNKVNIPDTLNNQCNCDLLWSKLDR
ncbi:hypothetical protein [Pedobacter sp. JY14-1]|uniref:hypothetical protein n=1 Tax=Pedobacter sp. JY14-1 TaxID=3034151 RepID=UPI0023E16FD9|nr:hypothetical protein [Pedobacter sp. JY14-1]